MKVIIDRARAFRATWTIGGLVVAAMLAGCSASASPTASPVASDTSGPSAVATSIDPCAIVTKDEVAKLTGLTSIPDGQRSTTPDHAGLCSYGQQGVVFEVIVAVAPDVATARSAEASAEQDLQQAAANGLQVTELAGFDSGAADATLLEGHTSIGGQSFAASAIYVLKGTDFFAISDIATLGAKAPSSADLQAQALVTLDRLP